MDLREKEKGTAMRTKRELRLEMKRLRGQVTPEEQVRAGIAVRENIKKLPVWKECDALYTFVSYQTEIGTLPLMELAWSENKAVAVPKVQGTEMDFYKISSMEELKPGYQGIPEPEGTKRAEYKKIFLLMPGLAFDREGNRLGYGGGFYDRYAIAHRDSIHCLAAVGYDFQFLHKIPVEKTDVAAEIIILPGGCFFPVYSV